MAFYRNTMSTRVIIDSVQRTPVIVIARAFYGPPLAFILGRNLIPILNEVRPYLTIGGDVAHKKVRQPGWVRIGVGAWIRIGAWARGSIERVAEADRAIAMQHLGIRACAALTIPGAGVVRLVF